MKIRNDFSLSFTVLLFPTIVKFLNIRREYIDFFYPIHIDILDIILIRNYPNITYPSNNILSKRTLHAIMNVARNSIFNKKTGNFYFLPITVDKRRILYATQQFCSLLRSGVPKRIILYISYDNYSCKILRQSGANCEVVNISKVKTLNNTEGEYRMKVYLLYLQNLWNLDAYTLDSDVIFFENIENAFYNHGIDVEISSDSHGVSQLQVARKKKHNSGFGRFLPTNASNKIIEQILNLSQISSGRDQILHTVVYDRWRVSSEDLNETESWHFEQLNASFRIIDPYLVANGGVAFCQGRDQLWKLIQQNSKNLYKMPLAIHFNWNMYNKTRTYERLGLNMCRNFNAKMVREFKKKVFQVRCITRWKCQDCYIWW